VQNVTGQPDVLPSTLRRAIGEAANTASGTPPGASSAGGAAADDGAAVADGAYRVDGLWESFEEIAGSGGAGPAFGTRRGSLPTSGPRQQVRPQSTTAERANGLLGPAQARRTTDASRATGRRRSAGARWAARL